MAALLMDEEISCSMSRVDDLRNVQMDKAWNNMGGPWMDIILNEACTVYPESKFFLASTGRPISGNIRSSAVVVHAGISAIGTDGVHRPDDDYPLCQWGQPSRWGGNRHLARGGTPEQAKAFSENFCKACLSRMSASDKVRVQQVFSR